MKSKSVLAIALIGLAATGARAESFTNEALFQAAAPGLSVESFEAYPDRASIAFLPCLGVTFEDPGDGLPQIVEGLGSSPSSGVRVLANRPVDTFSTQPIRLSRVDGASISAAAIYNSTSDDQLRMSFLDSDGAIIESTIIEPQPAPVFGGIVSSVGAATVEVAWTGGAGNGLHGFDDLQMAVLGNATPDADDDGVPDQNDNCALIPNPSQLDADGDNFGNRCDGDFNNDCQVDVVDLGIMRLAFFSSDANVDLNGDGTVNAIDLGIMKQLFFAAPGPSCLAICSL